MKILPEAVMLDPKIIRENPDAVRESIKQRGLKLDLDHLLQLSEKRGELISRVDSARARHKTQGKPDDLKGAKKQKAELAALAGELEVVETEYNELLLAVPNLIAGDVPTGDATANQGVRQWGLKKKHDFPALDHVELGKKLGILDFERSAKVSGARFYYGIGAFAELELALYRYALDILTAKNYTLVSPPYLVRREIIEGKGILSRAEYEQNVFKVEDEDLYLIGTGEIPLLGLHADETFSESELPCRYAAFTPCFRREAGTYGKHAKGLFRVHQFLKLEQFQFVRPEDSATALEEMVAAQEEIVGGLEIPYRVILVASGDMASYLVKQYDIEYYSAVDGEYRELMSAGNATDFQARRLNIKYKDNKSNKFFVHTLNATAAALSRLAIAVLENNQTGAGNVQIPKKLQPYLGRERLMA